MRNVTKTEHKGVYTVNRGPNEGCYKVRVKVTDPLSKSTLEKTEVLPKGATIDQAIQMRDAIKSHLMNQNEAHQQVIVTVGDYTVLWFERKAQTLEPTTKRTYYDAIDKFILPVLGDVCIHDLSRAHMLHWVSLANTWTKANGDGYARDTRRGWWRVLKQIMLDLKAEFGLVVNPVERVKPPSADGGTHRTKNTLTATQLAQLLDTARQFRANRYAEILMLATTGMRAGEMYGLKWNDIDTDNGIVHITRSSSRHGVSETTKTKYTRTAPLTDVLLLELQNHKKDLLVRGVIEELVFPSVNGGVRTANSLTKPLQACSEYIELDFIVTAQVLRRTFNTLGVIFGMDEITLRSIMGHRSPEMTEHYSGIGADQKHHAVATLWKEVLG